MFSILWLQLKTLTLSPKRRIKKENDIVSFPTFQKCIDMESWPGVGNNRFSPMSFSAERGFSVLIFWVSECRGIKMGVVDSSLEVIRHM